MQNQTEQNLTEYDKVCILKMNEDIESLRTVVESILELAKAQERAGDKVCTVGKSTLRILSEVLERTK